MNITATLIAQIVAFLLLIWLVNRLLWEPLTEALEKRRQKIADGLAAADQGQQDLSEATTRVSELEQEARGSAADIIARAEKRGVEIVAEAKTTAQEEAVRIRQAAEAEVQQQTAQAKESLRRQVSELAVMGAARVLDKEVDLATHRDALKDLEQQL